MRGLARVRGFRRRDTCLLAACICAGGVLSVAALPGHASTAAPSAKAAFANAPLPTTLGEVESSAEDIVDYALSGDRADAVAESARLKAAANGPAAAALRRSGVPPDELIRLEQRANRVAQLTRAGSFIGIDLAANAISQLMPELYGRFRNPVPAAILELDYLDREAQLRSLAHQPRKVADAVEGLVRAWPQVRPKVIAAGGGKEAAAYSGHVAAMKQLEPDARKRVQAEAVRGLELVDELERVFTR